MEDKDSTDLARYSEGRDVTRQDMREPMKKPEGVDMSVYHNIHVHTEYSILDGVGFTDEYAKIARDAKMGYVCVTDHGMAAAWPSLIDSCDKFGLRPVFGVEVYVNDFQEYVPKFKTLSEEMKKKVRRSDHMLLIAENEAGFKNLISLVSLGWEKGFYYKPRVSTQQIFDHSDGVMATTGCFSSPINQRLAAHDENGARDLVRRWADVFKDRLWVEWMMIDWQNQNENNRRLFDIAEDMGLPPIVTNDVHYADQDQATVQRDQLLIQSKGGTWSDPKGLIFDSDRLWFTTEKEMDERWYGKYRAMYGHKRDDLYEMSKMETLRICQKGGYINIDRSPKLPVIENADKELRSLCMEMMKAMGFDRDKGYMERLEEELELLEYMGFSSYFLMQKTIMDAACGCNDMSEALIPHPSPRSPGRGSVGGSLVAYLMRITQIDPLFFDTLFGRFLSLSRGGRQMVLVP